MAIAMKKTTLQNFAILAATTVLAGCASTGNPREGGIFWSETKARERQQVLRQQSRLSWEEAEREQDKTAQLKDRRASLRSSIAAQQKRISAMQSELSILRQNAANSEVASNAAELERQRTNLETSKAENTEQLEAQVRDLQIEIDRLKERNRLLKETR